jgi:hypothetical protein
VPEDVLVELAGLGLGLDPELALEGGEALLVLAEGAPAAAEAEVEAHKGAVDGLLGGVEGEEAKAGLEGGLESAGVALEGEEAGEGLLGELAEALALGEEPLLEGGGGDAEAGEEVAAVEGGGAGESVGGVGGSLALEVVDVQLDAGGGDADGVAVDPEEVGAGGLAKPGEGLPEAGARGAIGGVAPEEGREGIAGVALAWRGEGEVGEEGLSLA